MDLSKISSCLDVSDELIRAALAPARSLDEQSPRQRVSRLVTRMAEVATARQGAPKILLVFAHMATADWLEGELVVKLIGDAELTVIEALVDDVSTAERVIGPLELNVPFDELLAVVRSSIEVIRPLAVDGVIEPRRVVLRTTAELRRTSMPPAYSAVSDSLLPQAHPRELPKIMSHPPASEHVPVPILKKKLPPKMTKPLKKKAPPPLKRPAPPPRPAAKAQPARPPPRKARPPNPPPPPKEKKTAPDGPAPAQAKPAAAGPAPVAMPAHMAKALAAIKKKKT